MKQIVFKNESGEMVQYVETENPQEWLDSVIDKIPDAWTWEIVDVLILEDE